MEKYVKAEMEVIEFESEDVITTSSCLVVSIGIGCDTDSAPDPDESGTIWGD